MRISAGNSTVLKMLFGCLGFAIAGALAFAAADDFWALQSTVRYTAESFAEEDGQPDGPHTILDVERGPLTAGTVNVSAKLSTQATADDEGELLRIRILVADDDNENGVIDSDEKRVAALVVACSPVDGWTTAETGSMTVSAFHDWYRVVGDFRLADSTEFEYGNTLRFHGVED